MENQVVELILARLKSLDDSVKVVQADGKSTLAVCYGIKDSVTGNTANIAWLKWSLRGVWTSFLAILGYLGFGR